MGFDPIREAGTIGSRDPWRRVLGEGGVERQHSYVHIDRMRMIIYFMYDRVGLIFINYFPSQQRHVYFLKNNPSFLKCLLIQKTMKYPGTMANYYKQSVNNIVKKSFHCVPLKQLDYRSKRVYS